MVKNSSEKYGVAAKILHWTCAAMVVGLFGLGIWMVELSYYDDWYVTAPHYHNSLGILLALLMIIRLAWRITNLQPAPEKSLSHLEKVAAHRAHWLLYGLIFIMIVTGYLIPTADNRSIDVFNWFSVPALGSLFVHQEDIAGHIHKWCAYGLMLLAVIHATAALKHHLVNRDNTLRRML